VINHTHKEKKKILDLTVLLLYTILQDANKTGPEALPVSVLTLHKSWDKVQPSEHIKLNQKVKQTSLRFFLYM